MRFHLVVLKTSTNQVNLQSDSNMSNSQQLRLKGLGILSLLSHPTRETVVRIEFILLTTYYPYQ
jgi:hypothetical protein